MKLLIVTGISNSAWTKVVDGMELSLPCVSEQDTVELKEIVSGTEKALLNSKLSKFLESLGNKSHFTVLPNASEILGKLHQIPNIQTLVLYADPEVTLANALSVAPLTNAQSIEKGRKWHNELDSVYAVYRENREACMLVNCQDVLDRPNDAQTAISKFCAAEVKLSGVKLDIPSDALLAAKLALQDQDELFDYYDEIRCDAPFWGELSVSGIYDTAELANLAINSTKQHRDELLNLVENHSKHLNELKISKKNTVKELESIKNQLHESAVKYDELKKQNQESKLKFEQLTDQLNKGSGNSTALKKQLKSLTAKHDAQVQELNLLNKQIQEITALHDKELRNNNSLTSSLSEVKSQRDQLSIKFTKAKTELDDSFAETDLQKHQMSHLQSQLEVTYNDFLTAESKAEETALELSKFQAEVELLALHKQQLQEKLDTLASEHQSCKGKESQVEQFCAEIQILSERNRALETDFELACLQISQIQKELEHYYIKLHEKDGQKMQQARTIERLTQDVFVKCFIESFAVAGGYETNGYADIQLILQGVELADGRFFEQLAVKLFEVDGIPGLEFRRSEDTEVNPPLSWRDDMHDEFGSFIKFIPNPSESLAEQQQKTNESLSASERLLILSLANALSDSLQNNNMITSELEEGKLRDWKLVALRLKDQMSKLPEWLSFDTITLVEEMNTDNYEHLWIKFDNLLVNNHLHPKFELKFAALGPVKDDAIFTDTLMLELREQENNGAPLQAWPPLSHDEFGYKLQVKFQLQNDALIPEAEEKLSDHDKRFLLHLAKNFVHFVYELQQQKTVFKRKVDGWLSVADHVNKLSQKKLKPIESLAIDFNSDTDFDFQEHVDLDGYQHLVYSVWIEERKSLLIKLRAENINMSTRDADMSLELRTGNEHVPLAESTFFGEDEYGPRVLIALSDLEKDSFHQSKLTLGGKVVSAFMANINTLIHNNSALDVNQKLLWEGFLANEKR